MTLVGEFDIPRDQFILRDTLSSLPNLRLRLLRVAITDTAVSPLILVTPTEEEAVVDETIRADASLENVQQLATFESTQLYRAEWNEQVESEANALTTDRGDILQAAADPSGWRLTAHFTDRDAFDNFLGHLHEDEITFTLHRLGEMDRSPVGIQYGLTPKQHDALFTAWQMGYYELPRAVSLDAVADRLGISQQAVSQRLRRANDVLIAEALRVNPIHDE